MDDRPEDATDLDGWLLANGGPFVEYVADAEPGGENRSGPLAGNRLAVKDMIAVAGRRLTAGLAVHADRRADGTATAVRRLLAAGARLVGMTATDSAGFGTTTPGVANPRWPDHCAGGSSGGSGAAVAAGLADVALGTDTGGSVRIPAAACGVIAFKPTHGAVPMDGVLPTSPALDHVGPLAGDPGVLAAAARALLALPPAPGAATDPPVRVGYEPDRLAFAAPAVRAACEAALDRLVRAGATAVPIDLGDREDLLSLHAAIFGHEARAAHAGVWRPAHPGYTATADRSLRASASLAPDALGRVRADHAAAVAAIDGALRTVDVLLGPTLAGPPARAGARTVEHGGRLWGATHFHILETAIFNVSGSPALVTPADAPEAAPAVPPPSLQWVAARGRDAWLIDRAAVLAAIAAGTVPGDGPGRDAGSAGAGAG